MGRNDLNQRAINYANRKGLVVGEGRFQTPKIGTQLGYVEAGAVQVQSN